NSTAIDCTYKTSSDVVLLAPHSPMRVRLSVVGSSTQNPGVSMYSFDLTSEQRMLVDTVHRFAEQKLRPGFRDAEAARSVPPDVVQPGWALGLLPGSIDAEYGGLGDYSALPSALHLQEVGWGGAGLALHLLTPNLFALPVALFGTKDQKERHLPRFCDETFPKATAALTEPVYQFDPAALATTATRDDDGYLIEGVKTLVPLAQEAE